MKIANPVGKKGEDSAARYLHEKGYRVVEMNYRKNYTEIDIIAIQPVLGKPINQGILVFFEVKTRISGVYGTPFEAITKEKIKNVVRTAQQYQATHRQLPEQMRIDAIGITMDDKTNVLDIEHVENISY